MDWAWNYFHGEWTSYRCSGVTLPPPWVSYNVMVCTEEQSEEIKSRTVLLEQERVLSYQPIACLPPPFLGFSRNILGHVFLKTCLYKGCLSSPSLPHSQIYEYIFTEHYGFIIWGFTLSTIINLWHVKGDFAGALLDSHRSDQVRWYSMIPRKASRWKSLASSHSPAENSAYPPETRCIIYSV